MDFDLIIPTQKYFLVVTLYKQTNLMFMKNLILFGSALVIMGLSSCTVQQQFNVGAAEDDVYWSKRSDESKIQTLDDVNFDKQKDHKGGGSNYEPARNSNNSGSSYSEEERANQAYQTWNSQRGSSAIQSYDEQAVSNDQFNRETEEERDARRFGTERSFYYTDPYFNALSPNWGWTSWYSPIVRPGFYNWAPGWNVGFGWGSGGGWNMGFGNNMGFGGMGWGNPYGFNPWFNDPWNGFYNPYFYDPFAFNYGFGYNPWGFGYGYNPWFGYNNCWNCNRWRNNHCATCWNSGRDIVQNTPRFSPRGEGIGRGSSGSRPGSVNTGGQQSRPVAPAMRNAPSQASGDVPSRSGPNRNIRPDLNNAPSAPAQTTIRPGGDLIQGPGGTQTYIPPRNRTAPSASAAPAAGSNRPGGDLQVTPQGRTYYVPPRNSNYGGGSQGSAPTPSAPSNNTPSRSRPSFDPPSRSNSSPSYTPSPAPAPTRSGGGSSGSSGGSSGGGSRGSSSPVSRPR
jgi:hypothetical protein